MAKRTKAKFINLKRVCWVVFAISSNSAFGEVYNTIEVSPETYITEINKTGWFDYKEKYTASFKANGFVNKLFVKRGDRFIKGQILASLNADNLEQDKNLQFAKLLNAKRKLKSVELINSTKSDSYHPYAFSNEQDAIMTVEEHKVEYRKAYNNYKKTQIISQFDGIVLQKHVQLDQKVDSGQTIYELASLTNQWVIKIELDKENVNQLREKQTVYINIDSYPDIEGYISSLSSQPKQNHFVAEITIPNVDIIKGIEYKQLVDVIIKPTVSESVYKIPLEALTEITDGGNALISIQEKNSRLVVQSAFEIYFLDNYYVYVKPKNKNNNLTVVLPID